MMTMVNNSTDNLQSPEKRRLQGMRDIQRNCFGPDNYHLEAYLKKFKPGASPPAPEIRSYRASMHNCICSSLFFISFQYLPHFLHSTKLAKFLLLFFSAPSW